MTEVPAGERAEFGSHTVPAFPDTGFVVDWARLE